MINYSDFFLTSYNSCDWLTIKVIILAESIGQLDGDDKIEVSEDYTYCSTNSKLLNTNLFSLKY